MVKVNHFYKTEDERYLDYRLSEEEAKTINELITDVQIIANRYKDYFSIGRGYGNLMT